MGQERPDARLSYGIRLTDSGLGIPLENSKQLRFVAMNRKEANHDDDSFTFERRRVA